MNTRKITEKRYQFQLLLRNPTVLSHAERLGKLH